MFVLFFVYIKHFLFMWSVWTHREIVVHVCRNIFFSIIFIVRAFASYMRFCTCLLDVCMLMWCVRAPVESSCYWVTFPTRRGLAVHQARWGRPGQRPASRRGQLPDKAVKLAKRKASAALLPPVVMEGEALESVYQFDYLGCRFTSDGDDAADMRHCITIAGERLRSLDYLWHDNRLLRSLKLRFYSASVCSTLTHGSEAWMLTPRALAMLNGFNSRQLHRITGRSYRDEATTPSYDLLKAVRTRRH